MFTTNQFNSPGFLENVDMFGLNVNIRFNKQVFHKTKVGGVFSMIVFFLLCVQIYLVAQNLLDSQNPTVLYQQTFTYSPERFDINSKTFSLAFGLQDPQSLHYYDPTIYQITLWLKKTVRVLNTLTNDYTTQWDNRKVKLEQCTLDHFELENAKEYFLKLKFSKLLCISREEKDIYIQGQFDSDSYSGLQIVVESCTPGHYTPDGEDILCKSTPEINKYLNNGRLAVYYTDNAIITRNRDNPFQPLGRQSFWVSGPEFSKSLNISFRNSYLYTDVGLVTSEIVQERALTFSFDREQTTPKKENILYDCYISFEKNMNSEYHRSYTKLDRALSQIGGIYNFLIAIGCLLCKPISLIEFNRKLINSLFSFEDCDNVSQNNSNNTDDDKNSIKKCKQNDIIIKEYGNKDKDYDVKQSVYITPMKQTLFTQSTNPDFCDTLPDQNQCLNSQNQNLFLESKPSLKLRESVMQFASESKQIIDNNSPQNTKNSVGSLKSIARTTFRQLTQRQMQEAALDGSDKKLQSQQKSLFKSNNLNLSTINERTQKQPNATSRQSKQKGMQIKKDQQIKNENKEFESVFVQTFNQIRFKSWEYILSYFNIFSCWRTKKQQLMQIGVDRLYSHIDIFYIINKLIEVEKLKHLLLNENQLKLFEFMPRPILSADQGFNSNEKNNQFGILYEDKRTVLEKTLEAQKAYNKMSCSTHKMSTKDKRLIELLHPKFKHLIEDSIQSEPNLEQENSILMTRNEVRKTICAHSLTKTGEALNAIRI